MSVITAISGGKAGTEGNNIPQSLNTFSGKKNGWCFTLNNWKEEDWNNCHDLCLKRKCWYAISQEIAPTTGTPHLQGYIRMISAKSAIEAQDLIKCMPRISLRAAVETNHNGKVITREDSNQNNLNYISKGTNLFTNIVPIKNKISLENMILDREYKNVVWKDWQKQILEIIDSPPVPRKIYWIFDKIGNIGKSYLAKYICIKQPNTIIGGGKTNDIFNQTLEWRKLNPDEPQIPVVLMDVPRSDYAHINYAAIEQLKNGFMYSGKYEGGKVYGYIPHIFIFANSEVSDGQFSNDRIVYLLNREENEEQVL